MKLTRPLVTIDLETTNLHPEIDHITEIGLAKLYPMPDGRTEFFQALVNPGVPIEPEIELLTGITNAMVADAPAFEDVAEQLAGFLGDADLCGYNHEAFDVPFLVTHFAAAGVAFERPENQVLLDVKHIFKGMEPDRAGHRLTDAYSFYLGNSMVGAHRALVDAKATQRILFAQEVRYGFERLTPAQIMARAKGFYVDSQGLLVRGPDGITVAFGKYRGKTLDDLGTRDPEYFVWMWRNLGDEIRIILSNFMLAPGTV